MDLQGFGVDVYLSQLIFAAVDIPAKLVSVVVISGAGRRVAQAAALGLAGICILANAIVPMGGQRGGEMGRGVVGVRGWVGGQWDGWGTAGWRSGRWRKMGWWGDGFGVDGMGGGQWGGWGQWGGGYGVVGGDGLGVVEVMGWRG